MNSKLKHPNQASSKSELKELWQELGRIQLYDSPQSPQGKMKDIESRLKEIEALLQKGKQ